jgi:hypothetical protein
MSEEAIGPLSILEPGDCLGYATPDDLFDELTEWKTSSPLAHVEIYVGGGQSVASRNGIGMGEYPVRLAGLAAVRRPVASVDLAKLMAKFQEIKGDGYDWQGILRFVDPALHGQPNHFICSGGATVLYRATIEPFDGDFPEGLIEPGDFLKTPAFKTIWKNFTL